MDLISPPASCCEPQKTSPNPPFPFPTPSPSPDQHRPSLESWLPAQTAKEGERSRQRRKKREKTGRKINNESQSSASLRRWKERFWIKKSEMFQNRNKTVTLSFRIPSGKLIGVAQPGKRCQNWRETARSSGWSCWPTLAVNQFMP